MDLKKPAKETRPAEIIYQVYPASFRDSNGDGHGDLKGVTQKLDYIKSLGADAVWISPFYLSPPGPDGDGGYAVTDYRAIDPRFGDADDFKELLAEAHKRGLRIYIDFVLAHSASDHEWFEKSRRREDPYPDYYVWHDGRFENGQRVPPNNWKSVFGGEAWKWDQQRNQYYMHHFLPSQPKLNLNEEKVQDAVLAEMKFWLDLGVDGFRLDALPFSNHDPQFRHNSWRNGIWPNVVENWDQQRFDHSMCQPETVDLAAKIRKLLDAYPDKRSALGEAIAGRDGGWNGIEIAATYVDLKTGIDACYTDITNGISQKEKVGYLKHAIGMLQHYFPTGGHCNSIGNHDSLRTATRVADHLPASDRQAALRQVMQIFSTLPGSICLYQGEELGLPQAVVDQDIPREKLRDPVVTGPAAGRDGCRTPMPWEMAKKNAGFSTSDDPYLPVPQSHKPLAVDQQDSDPGSQLNFMRDLLHWRKNQPALVCGETIVLDTHAPVLAYLRRAEKQTLLCVFNLDSRPANFTPSDILDDALLAELSLKKGDVISLKGYGAEFTSSQGAARKPALPPPAP